MPVLAEGASDFAIEVIKEAGTVRDFMDTEVKAAF